ncbi:hypothetical protein GF406_26715 [candidate division KSB1 bacterium]|nr:hypothetical protein [candidate division KSB1 bacterium]
MKKRQAERSKKKNRRLEAANATRNNLISQYGSNPLVKPVLTAFNPKHSDQSGHVPLAMKSGQGSAWNRIEQATGGKAELFWDPQGQPVFLCNVNLTPFTPKTSAQETISASLDLIKAVYGLGQDDHLIESKTTKDDLGMQHYRRTTHQKFCSEQTLGDI